METVPAIDEQSASITSLTPQEIQLYVGPNGGALANQ